VSIPAASTVTVPPRLGLTARLGIILALLAVETLTASYLIQLSPLDTLTSTADTVHRIQHWLFRFVIAYGISLAMLAYLRAPVYAAAAATAAAVPLRLRWLGIHLALLAPFAYLSAQLYAGSAAMPFPLLALAWHLCALAGCLALFAAMGPLGVWRDIVLKTHGLPLFAILPAAAAVAAIRASQLLWAPAAELTFRIVGVLLHPLLPQLRSDPVALVLGTSRFAVQIAEVCSGLEGVGLLLAFCAGWLWLFRRDYYFPRALLIVPLGVLVIFLLNALRIAAVVLIGNAGYERVAMLGFHSQAGWIAFNLTAFGIAVLAHHSPWVSRVARRAPDAAVPPKGANPTAAFLMPLLVILAAGMISHALSADFEFLYPLRFVGALAALWVYRRSYAALDWRCTWRAPLVGALVFALWAAAAAVMTHPAGAPPALEALSPPTAAIWIVCRVLAAVFTVPIAEELAYRGYLLRRLSGPQFETVPLSHARWPAVAVSSAAFGLMHGALWLPGILAGFAYGALAVRTGRLGESIVAHGTTNALLAVYVLAFGQWQLW
jgi:exosortase E/protease (VPEID-CTERM system)